MDTELKLELASVRDESIPNRLGKFERFKRYEFFLGAFGPFVERVPIENTDDGEFQRRVTKLRAHTIQAQQH